jgi:hypothetical protein
MLIHDAGGEITAARRWGPDARACLCREEICTRSRRRLPRLWRRTQPQKAQVEGGILCTLDICGSDTKSAHIISIPHLRFNRKLGSNAAELGWMAAELVETATRIIWRVAGEQVHCICF